MTAFRSSTGIGSGLVRALLAISGTTLGVEAGGVPLGEASFIR